MESGERRRKHRHRESNIEIDHKKIKDKKRRHHRRKNEERNLEHSNSVSKNNQPNTESSNSVKRNKDEIYLKYNIHGDNVIEIGNVKKETKDHKHRKHKASKENSSADRQIVEKYSEYKNKSHKKQFAQLQDTPSAKESLQKCKTFHSGENYQHRPRSSIHTKLKDKEERKPRAKSEKHRTENKVSEIWYCHIDNTEPFKDCVKNQECSKTVCGKVRQKDHPYVKERAKSSPEDTCNCVHQHKHLSNATKSKNAPLKEHSKSVLNVTKGKSNVEEIIGKECSRTIEHNLKSYFVKIEKLIDQKLNSYLQQKNTTRGSLEGKQGQAEKERNKHKRNHKNRESNMKKRNVSISSESSRNENESRKLSVSPARLHQRSRSMFADNVEMSPSNVEQWTKKQKTKFKEQIKSKDRSKSGKRENPRGEKKFENAEEDYKNINFEKAFIRRSIRSEEKENKVRKNKRIPESAVSIPNGEGLVAASKYREDVQEYSRYYPDKQSEIRERRLKSRHRTKREDFLHVPTQPDPALSKNYTRARENAVSKQNRRKLSPTNNNNASINIPKEKYRMKPTDSTNLVDSPRNKDYIENPSTSIVYFKPSVSSENINSLSLYSQDASRMNYFSKQRKEDNMPCQRYSQRPESYSRRKSNFTVEGIEPAKRLNTTKTATKNTSLKKNLECKTVSVITIPPQNQSTKYIPLEEERENLMENPNKMKRLKLYYQCSLDSNKCSGSNFSEDRSVFNESLKILSDFSTPNRDFNETQQVNNLPIKHKDSVVKDSSSILPPTRERRNKFDDEYHSEVSNSFDNHHSSFPQSNSKRPHRIPSISPNQLSSPDRDIKNQQEKRKIKHLPNDGNLKSKSDISLVCKISEDNSALQKKLMLLEGLKDNKDLKLQKDTALFNLKVLKNALKTQNMLSKEQFPNNNNQILQHLENMYHIYLATLSHGNNEVDNKNRNITDDQVVTTQQDVTNLHKKVEKLVDKAEKIDERPSKDIADKQLHPKSNHFSHHDDKKGIEDLENCKYKTVDTSYHNLIEDNQPENFTKITCPTELKDASTSKKLITTSDKVTSYHELPSFARKDDSNDNNTDAYYISHNSITTSTENPKEIGDKTFKSSDKSAKMVKTVMTTKGLKGKENKANCASNVTPEDLIPKIDISVEKVNNQVEEDHDTNFNRKITEMKDMSHVDTVCTIEIQTQDEFMMLEVPHLEKKEIGVQSLVNYRKPLTSRPSYIEETPKTPKKTSRIPQCINKLPKEAHELTTGDSKRLDLQDITKDEQSYKLKDKPGDMVITNFSQLNKEINIKNEPKEEVRDPAMYSPRKQKQNNSSLVPSTRIPRKMKQHSTPAKDIKTRDNYGGDYLLKKSQSEISLRKLNSSREKGRTSSLICLHRYLNNPNLADSSNSGVDSFYLGRSVVNEPNVTSRLLLTKDYKPPQMSSYQRRKIYDKSIRSKLKKKMCNERKVRQIFEVRYLTLGKNLEGSNAKVLNKIPENLVEESIERPIDEFMDETLRLLGKKNSEKLLTFIQENIDTVKRLNVVELLRRLADSAECSKLETKVKEDTSKEVVNFFIALNHCLRTFCNSENPATHIREAVSSNDSTIVQSSETYTLSKQSGITRNCSCRTIQPSNSSFDFLYQDDDNQNLVEKKINFNPILGFTFKHNSKIKQTETGSFAESYNSEDSGYVRSEKSKHDPLTFFKRPIMAELLRPRAELFGNTPSCYEMKNESMDTIKEDIAPSITSYYPYAELNDSFHVNNNHSNNAKDGEDMNDTTDKDDSLIFETVEMSTNIRLKRYAYPYYHKNEDIDKLLELEELNTQKMNSGELKLKESISNVDFSLKKEEFTSPKRAQSEIVLPKYSQIGYTCNFDENCENVFQPMPLFREIMENNCLEDIVVLKKILDPGVYLMSTNFNMGYITLHINTEEHNTTNSPLFDENLLNQNNLYIKYDVSTCSCISDVKKLTTMKFFENLLNVYEIEEDFSFKLFSDKSFMKNELFSVISQIKPGKGKGKFTRRMRFFFKNIFCGKEKVRSKKSLDNGDKVIYPLDESFQKSFQILADYAVKNFSQLIGALLPSFEKNDEYKIYGFLTLLHKIKSGHFNFIKVSKISDIKEEMKNQIKQAFQNVYLIASDEAYHLQRKFSENDMKLAGALVCKYRSALLIQNDLVASYLGKGFFKTELELKGTKNTSSFH
uniref:Uncharacterized protein LOC114328118 n=1 Tax=Diabrotica virgifera virgifera TaxID=50390 RepID=A0A6P7FHW9_DIAVI